MNGSDDTRGKVRKRVTLTYGDPELTGLKEALKEESAPDNNRLVVFPEAENIPGAENDPFLVDLPTLGNPTQSGSGSRTRTMGGIRAEPGEIAAIDRVLEEDDKKPAEPAKPDYSHAPYFSGYIDVDRRGTATAVNFDTIPSLVRDNIVAMRSPKLYCLETLLLNYKIGEKGKEVPTIYLFDRVIFIIGIVYSGNGKIQNCLMPDQRKGPIDFLGTIRVLVENRQAAESKQRYRTIIEIQAENVPTRLTETLNAYNHYFGDGSVVLQVKPNISRK
jgi:hypothetical protein